MGTCTVNLKVIGPNGLSEDVDALMDTGATYASLPVSLLMPAPGLLM